MSFSYASKMIIFIYQYQYFDDKNICFNNDSKPDFGVFYALIDISYILRITVFFVSCFLLAYKWEISSDVSIVFVDITYINIIYLYKYII